MGAVTHSNLDDVFSYHKPKGDFQTEKYHRIRSAAKVCAKAILDDTDPDKRQEALDAFSAVLRLETGGDSRDAGEALGMLASAGAFARGVGAAMMGAELSDPEAQSEATQAVIQCIRAAVMWANASVALEGKI